MKQIQNFITDKLSSLSLVWFLLMLLAAWSIYIQNGSINRDGLGYLQQASMFANSDWEKGFSFYPWPFFSLLLAFIHKLTNFHLQLIAHIVCFMMFGIAVYFFLKILRIISKEKIIYFFGGLVLSSSIPIMDDYVGMILRDHGLWAASMSGTYFFLISQKNSNLRNTIAWQLCFFIGGLFRPESFVFLIFLPLWNFYINKKKLLLNLFKDYLLIFLLLSAYIILTSSLFYEILLSTRLIELTDRPILIVNNFFTPLPIRSDDLMLDILIQDNIFLVGSIILFSIVIFKWLQSVGVLNIFLFSYSLLNKRFIINNQNLKSIFFFLVLSFLIVSTNTLYIYVLSNRYWSYHIWWLYILIALLLKNLLIDKSLHLFIRFIVYVSLIICILNSLIDENYNTEIEIANYINNNFLNDVDFNNNERISYYMNHDILTFKDYKLTSQFQYRIININQSKNIEPNSENVIKVFPDNDPKFAIIKYDN
jgi:hypothetical protein